MKFWPTIKQLQSALLTASLLALAVGSVWPQPLLAAAACESNYGEASLILEYVSGPSDRYSLEQPIAGASSVATIGEYIQLVYQFAVGLASIIAVVLIMVGGLRWIAAAGNESAITQAKEMITSAVLGLIIAMLSYTILLFLNPTLLDIETKIAKIPLPLACGTPDPVVESIPSIAGLNGKGSRSCQNLSLEIQRIATEMRASKCSTCTIVVGNSYRTHESQAELYSCYIRAKEELGVTDGSKCPDDCGSCNLAAKPCCGNHEDGMAVDLYLEGSNKGLASSAGFLKGYQNNGGSGGSISQGAVGGDCTGTKNPDLCLNQQLLREIMTKTTNSKFTSIDAEWWHFDFQGTCNSAGTTCTPVAGKADNAYCKANSETIYKLADCNGSAPSCPASDSKSWTLISGSCATGQHYEFSTGATRASGTSAGYNGLPGCVNN
jgi:D-alanyl-D-alanine dipeptidase